jgi:hypothetical protein
VNVAVGQKERSNAPWIACHEQLRDRSAAVTSDKINGSDGERVEQGGQHVGLRFRRQALTSADLAVPESHGVRSDASTIRRQTLECTAPLEPIQWQPVDEESGESFSSTNAIRPNGVARPATRGTSRHRGSAAALAIDGPAWRAHPATAAPPAARQATDTNVRRFMIQHAMETVR